MWLLYSIITAVCWGLVLATVKRSYNSFSPTTFVFVGTIAAILILLPFALINGAKLILWPLLPAGILVAALFIFEFYALEKGKLSLTGTVLNTYPFFTFLLARIFLQESTDLLTRTGVGLILVGIVMLSFENWSEIKKIRSKSWLMWGLAGALSTGSGDFFIKSMVDVYGPYSYSLAFVVGWLIIALIIAIFDRKNIQIKFSQNFLYLVSGAVFLFSGYIFLHLALRDGLVSIVTPITASSATISLFLAVVWLKEKIKTYQIIGALLATIGVVIISTA